MNAVEYVIALWTDQGRHVVSEDICQDGKPVAGILLAEFASEQAAVDFALSEAETRGLALTTIVA